MINPDTILAEWVTTLQNLPNLVEALGGDGDRIQFYTENTVVFGQPTQNNIRLAILSMPPGSLMVAWDGSGSTRLGNMLVFAHHFSLYLRAPERAGAAGYGTLWNWIVNDIPQGGTLRMLHTAVDPACEPMDLRLPEAHRESIVISDDGATFDHFRCTVSLVESSNT